MSNYRELYTDASRDAFAGRYAEQYAEYATAANVQALRNRIGASGNSGVMIHHFLLTGQNEDTGMVVAYHRTTRYDARMGQPGTTSAAATLLRTQALHQRQHQYITLTDYITGDQNRMADDASRLFHLNDMQLLTHFNSLYPQTQSWQLWNPIEQVTSVVISSLHKKPSSRA